MEHFDVIKDDPFKDENYTDSSIGDEKVKIQYFDVWGKLLLKHTKLSHGMVK